MTRDELAARLNGREYGNEITKTEEKAAKEAGLVVLFGASDDLAEFRGAIHDEIGCYDGGEVLIVDGGIFDDSDECECVHAKAARDRAESTGQPIELRWDNDSGYSWTYATKIPHASFDVMEGDEKYCRGIVFALEQAK